MSLHSPARSWLLARLAARHAELERAIAEELARPAPDEATLRRLKREKLQARDRIAAIERGAMEPWAQPEGAPAPRPAARIHA